MPNYTGIYLAQLAATSVSIAKTLVQINAPADAPIELLRAWVSFNSVTSTAIEIGIKRVSTAGTGTSFTALLLRQGNAAFGGTTTTDHTAEGTIGDVLMRSFVNYLNGFLYLPIPEERIIIQPSGRLSLYLPTAPGAAVTISAGVIFAELS